MHHNLTEPMLADIRAGLTDEESARFTDEQIEARYQYQHGTADAVDNLITVLKDSAVRQASSAERGRKAQHNQGKLRAQWVDPPAEKPKKERRRGR